MNESRPEDSQERTEDSAEATADATTEAAEPDATPPSATADEGGGDATDGTGDGTGSVPPADGRARSGRWLAAIALLLALAAAGTAGYLGWRLYQLEQRVATIPEQRARALDPYLRPDALQPLRARVESLEAEREALAGRLEERVEQLSESIDAVRARAERHQIGWRLAEIRYLVAIAIRRLTIAYDMEGAEAALAAADDAVASLQDVRLIPLRKALVEDLGDVREVRPADIEGIALRLQSLLNRVDDLPRAPINRGAPDSADGNDGWWQQLKDRLADFVVIQRRPGGPAPVVPKHGPGIGPGDALTLALEDARRAALARDQESYSTALQRAGETLAAHFDDQAGATIRFREGLAEVAGRNVDTAVPDLTDTLDLARRLAAEVERERRALESDQAPAREPAVEEN